MSIERAAMRGKLAEASDRQAKLNLKMEGLCRHIREGLNTSLTPPEELEIPLLDEQWSSLKEAWLDLIIVKGKIAHLQKELK